MEDNIFISQTKVSFEVPQAIIYDRKFDTAIRQSQIDSVLERLQNGTPYYDDQLIFETSHYDEHLPLQHTSDCYSMILLNVLKPTYKIVDAKKYNATMKLIPGMIESNLKFQLNYLHRNNTLPNIPTLAQATESFFRERTYPEWFKNLVDMTSWMCKVVESSNRMYQWYRKRNLSHEDQKQQIFKTNSVTHHSLPLTIVWSHQLCYIKYETMTFLLPKPYILMIHNKLADMVSVVVTAIYGDGTFLQDGALDLTYRFITELAKLSRQYKNKVHQITKLIEPIAIGETLISVEHWTNREFLQTLQDALFDEIGFDYNASILKAMFNEADVPMKHELACLSKLIGHPLVLMEEGAQSLFDKTHEIYKVSVELILQCENYIKENYIRNCIVKTRKWPPHIIHPEFAHPALSEASRRDVDPNVAYLTMKFGRIPIEACSSVELLPNMKYSKLENSIPYLKDKTISLCRSKVVNAYLTSDTEVRKENRPKWEDTRLLLAYLLHPDAVTNHMQYIEDYENSDTLDDLLDYLVIRIVPKEKEHKELFRGFGCKTAQSRMATLAQEKNAMKFLDEYSDEQAMTLGELELTRRLHAFRRLHLAYRKHQIIYVNMDASSWNNHFRAETVDDIMPKTLDAIFGTKIYRKTHLAYQKTMFYIPDCRGTYYWVGQEGGIEGLNQDTWVITYIAQIKTALSHMKDIRYHILCKGDDFRLALVIPDPLLKDINIGEYKTEVVRNISKVAAQLGHVIKIDDSYGSQRYFNFSKVASVDTVELPQVYRKIQKCYGANNAFLSTLDDYIGSTFSNAHSACKANTTTVGCYAVALYWSYYYLLHHPIYNALPKPVLTHLLLVPSLFGGFPIIYLHNMYVRAEADLMTPFLDMYLFARNFYPQISDVFEKFLYISSSSPPSLVGLFKDPYTVPINRPTLPEAFLRSQILPVLKKRVKNETIQELIAASESDDTSILVDVLETADPCHIKILSNLYACLPPALLDEVMRKFESSRTIYEFFVRTIGMRRSLQILRNVVRRETYLQKWRLKRIEHGDPLGIAVTSVIDDCPYKWAMNIRKQAWNKEIEGITMPPYPIS